MMPLVRDFLDVDLQPAQQQPQPTSQPGRPTSRRHRRSRHPTSRRLGFEGEAALGKRLQRVKLSAICLKTGSSLAMMGGHLQPLREPLPQLEC